MSATYKKCANGHYYSALLERCPYCKPSDVGNICNAHNISKDNLYYSIKEALFQHTEELCVSNDVDENAIRQGIRRVMRDCPEIFWFAHQYTYNPETHRLHLNYQFSKERRSFIQRSIDNVIEHDLCIGYVRTLSAYEQVAYVYKWLLTYCNYNVNSAYNQTIDSVFVRRNSVCTGYAKAAQYIFQQIGIPSQLVFGRLNNDLEGGRHCWNIVSVEGAAYHLDICLGDPLLVSVLKSAGDSEPLNYGEFNYNCFCVSSQEIAKTRSIEDAESLPDCTTNIPSDRLRYLSGIVIRRNTSFIGCQLTSFGSSADIYNCANNKHLVFKKFRDASTLACEKEWQFMNILCDCPHLIHMDEKSSDVSINIIALEYMTPVTDLFCSRYYKPTLRSLLTMIRDVALAWQECYERGVYYRDIHICNVYRANDGTYKLGDFGSCAFVNDGRREVVGNPWFMAPETYNEGIFNQRSAVYAISSLLYFVLNGFYPPFLPQCSEEMALAQKKEGKAWPMPSLLSTLPPSLKEQLEKLFLGACSFNPKRRYRTVPELIDAIEDLLNEKWLDVTLSFARIEKKYIDRGLTMRSSYALEHEHTCFVEDVEQMSTTVISAPSSPMPENVESYCCTRGVSGDPYEGLFPRTKPNTFYPGVQECSASRWWTLLDLFRKRENEREVVYGSIFAPAEVKRKSHMLIQVYLHLAEDTEKIIGLARESQADAERRDYIPLQCLLKKGDRVCVRLSIHENTLLMTDQKEFIWGGKFLKYSFDYFVPEFVSEMSCQAVVSIDGVPVGEMRFIIKTVESPRQLNSEIFSHKFSKIFISYAHQDEERVKFLAEGFRLIHADYFFDRHYLRGGDIYPRVIADYIEKADLFVLCWSANAEKSEYVAKELAQAMQRAYPIADVKSEDQLMIYPISISPKADLPVKLQKMYNFVEL